MPNYLVYGGCLSSAVALPELRESLSSASPDWFLEVASGPAPQAGERLGSEVISERVTVHLDRLGAGFRLTYDDTGTFDVEPGGHRIRWWPGTAVDAAAVQADILGRVLATALHAGGRLCLHASAVCYPPGAVAFTGAKHHGKSTLALRAVANGARLLTDDTLLVTEGEPVLASPGVHGLRVWSDVLARWPGPAAGAAPGEAPEKQVLSDLPDGDLAHEPCRLRAIYVLVPSAPQAGAPPVHRGRLPDVVAALQLVRLAKIGALLGRSEAPVLLERAARVVRSVPVYSLHLVRDLGALDAVVALIAAWVEADASGSLPFTDS